MYIMYIYIYNCLILTCEKEIYNVIWSPNRPPASVTEEKSGTGVIAYVLGYPSSELASETVFTSGPPSSPQSVNNHIVVVTMTGKGDNPKAYVNNFFYSSF